MTAGASREWAIQLPNGELFSNRSHTAWGEVIYTGPKVYHSRQHAEHELAQLVNAAQQFGVEQLGASIVWRYTGPWVTDATAERLVGSVEQWLASNVPAGPLAAGITSPAPTEPSPAGSGDAPTP